VFQESCIPREITGDAKGRVPTPQIGSTLWRVGMWDIAVSRTAGAETEVVPSRLRASPRLRPKTSPECFHISFYRPTLNKDKMIYGDTLPDIQTEQQVAMMSKWTLK